MSIADEITRLQSAKANIKSAIENKGVTVPSAAKISAYPLLINAIPSGGGAVLGTKSITANGTYEAEDDSLDGYSEVTVAVPNSYSASDEGKVVSNGALVAQTAHADVTPTTSDQTIDTTLNNSLKVKGDADLVASNIKKDVEIFGVTGSYEGGGGGGGVDLSSVAVPVSQNSVGGMFQAMIDGNWGKVELTVTSGTNPITVDFGRAIKGYISYPKNITLLSGLTQNEHNASMIAFFNDPDVDGVQTLNWASLRYKSGGNVNFYNRITSYNLTNGLLSIVPQYPSNAQYNPFEFNTPYIFIYWWDGGAS